MQQIVRAIALLSIVPFLSAYADTEKQDWTERLHLSGDLRLRYEEIKRETQVRRDRGRYRARLALIADVSDKVKVVMELASAADNPVSRNVTFDGGFSGDDIGFDLVYVDWTPIDGMHVYVGKMKNPFFRAGGAPLIWDSDLNPEGIALTNEKGVFFGNAGAFSVEERSESGDSTLMATQIGAKFDIGDKSKLTAGVGYFRYSNTIGNEPFHDGEPKGNSVDLLGNYIFDYKDTELFAVFDTRVGELPLSIHVQWAHNNEVDEQDAGLAYGAKLGSARDKGQWEFGWTYQDIEADAVIGTFNDSDFGDSGTDASGHLIEAKYAVSKSIFLGATFFINKINSFSLPEEDYDRMQLDVEFRFK